jgi:hypothetical protein
MNSYCPLPTAIPLIYEVELMMEYSYAFGLNEPFCQYLEGST